MLFPVSFKDLALLVGAHPREIVYHAVIDSITVSHNGRVALFRNHPRDNDHSDSDVLGKAKSYDYSCDDKLRDTNSYWSAEEMFENPDNCNYAKFVRWLQLYDDYGFTAELVPGGSAAPRQVRARIPSTPRPRPSKTLLRYQNRAANCVLIQRSGTHASLPVRQN